LVTDEVGSWTE